MYYKRRKLVMSVKILHTLLQRAADYFAPVEVEPKSIEAAPQPQEKVQERREPSSPKPLKNQKPVPQQGTIELEGSMAEYVKKLSEFSKNDKNDPSNVFIDMMGNVITLSRTMDCSIQAVFCFNSTSGENADKTEQTVTVLARSGARWKKLFSNDMLLDNLDVFVREFELAFEQHGYASHHDSTKLFKDFLTSALVPAIAKQRKKRVDEPQKKTHLRMTVKAYTDNTTNPLDCPSIVTTVTYTENEIPSSVSMTMKYQKPQSNAYA